MAEAKPTQTAYRNFMQESPVVDPTALTCKESFTCAQNPNALVTSFELPQDDLIWYAAYDEDMRSQVFLDKLLKISPGDSQVGELPLQSTVMIKGNQICFDTALSDYPLVREFRAPSPNTNKYMAIKNDETTAASHVYAKLYCIKKS